MKRKCLLFLLLFSITLTGFSQEESEETLRNLLISLKDFYTEDGATYTFFEGGTFKINHYSLAQPYEGRFKFSLVTLPKRDWGIDKEGTMTTMFLSFFIGKQEAIWLMKTQQCKAENGKLYLYFVDTDKGIRSKTIALIHKRKPTNYSWSKFADDWSEIIARNNFTKSVDILTRSWLAILVEESMKKENEEEALEYALDKILYFPDEERKVYGELIKKMLLSKNEIGY